MNSDAFTVEQLARIEQGEAWGALLQMPDFSETYAAFKDVYFDIAQALTELDRLAADARQLRRDRNVLQGDYLVAADDVQLNTALARKLIGQIEAAVQRALTSNPALGRRLRARIPAAGPRDAIRDVRAALHDRVDQLADAVADLTTLGLPSSFRVEAAVIEDHYVVLIDGAVVASSARASHTRKLHAALDRLGAQINLIEGIHTANSARQTA